MRGVQSARFRGSTHAPGKRENDNDDDDDDDDYNDDDDDDNDNDGSLCLLVCMHLPSILISPIPYVQ